MWGLELLKKRLREFMGNEDTIRLFLNPWLPRPSTFKVITSHTSCQDSHELLVSQFILPSMSWDIPKVARGLMPRGCGTYYYITD